MEAGIEDIVFVVSEGQREPIDRYFSPQPALEQALAARNNTPVLEQMREIARLANVTCVTQTEQKGLGHAVLMARKEIGDEPFAVFLPDDVIWADSPTIGQMIEIHNETGGNVVALEEVSDEDVPSKGIVAIERISETTSRIASMVEKPALEDAPSNLAIVGRYVLGAEILDTLENVPPGALGEIQLTDAIARSHGIARGVRLPFRRRTPRRWDAARRAEGVRHRRPQEIGTRGRPARLADKHRRAVRSCDE